MTNPSQSVDAGYVASQPVHSRVWTSYWLLSYICPFFVLGALLLSFGEAKTSGSTTLLVLFCPFAFGLIGTIFSFSRGKVDVGLAVLLFLATIVAYMVGFGVLCLVLAMIFGVTAT